MSIAVTDTVSVVRPCTPLLAPMAPPVALEYTTETVGGVYRAIRSWAHLDELAGGVGAHSGRFLVVQRRADPGQRFAQCSASAGHLVVDVGALDAPSARHTVWRLHRPHVGAAEVTADHFVAVARDWLSVGVVPGYIATALPLGADDEPL